MLLRSTKLKSKRQQIKCLRKRLVSSYYRNKEQLHVLKLLFIFLKIRILQASLIKKCASLSSLRSPTAMCIQMDFPLTSPSSPHLKSLRTQPASPGTCGRSVTLRQGSRLACVSTAIPALWTSSTPALARERRWGPSMAWRGYLTASGTSLPWAWRAIRWSCS